MTAFLEIYRLGSCYGYAFLIGDKGASIYRVMNVMIFKYDKNCERLTCRRDLRNNICSMQACHSLIVSQLDLVCHYSQYERAIAATAKNA